MVTSNFFLNVLNDTHISFQLHNPDDSQSSGIPFAEKQRCDAERTIQTIFFRSKDRRRYVAVITSSNKELDLPYITQLSGCDEILPAEELHNIAGCKNGMCPFQIPRFFKIMIDECLIKFSTILIESSSMGVIEVKPFDFLYLVQGQLAHLTEW